MTEERGRLALARPDLLREQAFIGGRWIGDVGGFEVTNPATGGVLAAPANLGAVEAEAAVAAAHGAFPAWSARPAKERASILKAWHRLILDHTEDLARLMTAEQGKPLAEARGEVAYAAAFIEWFAEEARRIYGVTIPGHMADKRLVVTHEPVGVVGAIALELPGRDDHAEGGACPGGGLHRGAQAVRTDPAFRLGPGVAR